MFVTVVATCTILIRTSVFQSFDQKEFSSENAHERLCKDDVKYNGNCTDWYKRICLDEHNELDPYVIANPGSYIRSNCETYIRNFVV